MLRRTWNVFLCMVLVFGIGVVGCGDSGDKKAVCGNNIVEEGEACDGTDLNNMTCQSLGYTGGTLACTDNCEFDESGCIDDELCGNGEIDPGEDCDGDDLGGETCEGLGFDGGELTCSATCRFNTSGCYTAEGCEYDDAVEIDSLGVLELHVDTTVADDSVDISCEDDDLGTADHIFELTVLSHGNLVISPSDDWHVMAMFSVPDNVSDCFASSQELLCYDPYFDGIPTTIPDVAPGVYYLVVSDWSDEHSATVDITITLGCPPGMHEDNGGCVYDTCEYLDCESMHMECDDSEEPAVCSGCLEGYVEEYGRCVVEGLSYGSPCESDWDCPGTGQPGSNIVCNASTGGYCMSMNSPECASPGQPCTDDEDSMCLVYLYWGMFEIHMCIKGCENDGDCRPGYYCNENAYDSGYSGCTAISDCEDYGCNDPDGTIFCNENENSLDFGFCWIDGCENDPCDAHDNTTGTCINIGDGYGCECDEDHAWDLETMECEDFTCGAEDLGTWGGEIIEVNGNSCDGTSIYGNSALACIGWDAPGQELVYSLTVPAAVTIEITFGPAEGNDQDSVLYLLAACNDTHGYTCLAGVDDEWDENPEVLVWNNDTGSDLTVYIVGDAYEGCGPVLLTIEQAE